MVLTTPLRSSASSARRRRSSSSSSALGMRFSASLRVRACKGGPGSATAHVALSAPGPPSDWLSMLAWAWPCQQGADMQGADGTIIRHGSHTRKSRFCSVNNPSTIRG